MSWVRDEQKREAEQRAKGGKMQAISMITRGWMWEGCIKMIEGTRTHRSMRGEGERKKRGKRKKRRDKRGERIRWRAKMSSTYLIQRSRFGAKVHSRTTDPHILNDAPTRSRLQIIEVVQPNGIIHVIATTTPMNQRLTTGNHTRGQTNKQRQIKRDTAVGINTTPTPHSLDVLVRHLLLSRFAPLE